MARAQFSQAPQCVPEVSGARLDVLAARGQRAAGADGAADAD
ncbi:hypothetical protein [Ornithinimicrobium sp. F0845]|nr:hypothetical protein [Ornithinimicrobium sp. F0845]